jgi:membrane carboxypeptidase/penicillin-binding protein
MAGKTGTVPKNRAIWTVGYTPELVAASMISYDSHKDYKKFWKSRPSFLRNIRLPASGTYLSGFSGGDAGNRLLRPAFAAAIKAYPKTKFKKPPESVLRGKWLSVPSCTGMSVGGCRGALARAGFSSHLDEVESPEPKGTVLGTDPAGKAPKLSSVAIKVSDGKGKQPEEEEPDDENPATPPPRRGG